MHKGQVGNDAVCPSGELLGVPIKEVRSKVESGCSMETMIILGFVYLIPLS